MRLILLIISTSTIVSCAAHKPYVPPTEIPDDQVPITKPMYRDDFNEFTDFFDKQFSLQAEQAADLSRHIRYLSSNYKEAYNVDALGEVANSSWFTNRNAISPLSIVEIANGPNSGSGPDTDQEWTIISAKTNEKTVGFSIIDAGGDKYDIRFDPLGFSGLNSGSEVIGSKIFHAVGYNVPENYITYFDPSHLSLDDEARITDDKGRKRLMTNDDLSILLSRVHIESDGLIRATASKHVEGQNLGPFEYEGTRDDDPNDMIPHQHRRELRGLRVIGAWINFVDAKSANSMDTFIDTDSGGYVKHYLNDFGTALGSGGVGPQPIYRGHENETDPKALLLRMLTFGLYVPEWEKVPSEVDYPCIGRFYSEYFHPFRFKPLFPNPAYDNLTPNDGYWGAKQVMSFSDEQIKAIVDQARYPSSEAADYLVKTLIERRDITGKYWYNRVTPLDSFDMIETDDGLQILTFDDLAVNAGLETNYGVTYRYKTRLNELELTPQVTIGNKRSILIPEIVRNVGAFDNSRNGVNQLEFEIQLKRDYEPNWSSPVKLYLSKSVESDKYAIIGIKRLCR